MNKRMVIMLVSAGVLFGGIFGFKAFVSGVIADVFDNMEEEAVTVSSTTVRRQDWRPRFEAAGTLTPVSGAELSIEIGGVVREIHFENGQRVEAGQRLVSLDTRVDEAELAQLQAALRLAELELARQRPLFEQRSISRAELERAESEADQARAAVAGREALIDQKNVSAPFDGRLGIRQINPGQYLSPGTPVVSLQSVDPITLDFNLPQRLLPRLSQGQRVEVRFDAYPDETFKGDISAIQPEVRVSTRTVLVQATLDNPDEKLKPGMFGRVELDMGDAESLIVLPQTALRTATYGDSVFVIEEKDGEKVVSQRFVQTGRTRGDLIAILEGLEEGEEVAASGLLKLQNNARVKIDNDEETRPSEDDDPRPANS